MTSYIGTYAEKSVHRDLKWRLEPTGAFHEVPVGKYIADIKTEAGITEIQTRQFHRLRAKLAEFLPGNTVVLVYPLTHEKIIQLVDPESGEIIRTRKSPKKGSFYDAFYELYQIKPFLCDVNLIVRLVLVDVTERRSVNANRRKHYDRTDARIRAYREEMLICGIRDYKRLIPEGLNDRFTSAEYAAASGLNLRNAGIAVNVLNSVGAVERIGTQKRYYLYKRK